MKTPIRFILSVLTIWTFASTTWGEGYPEASLDQATTETIRSLKIERYAGLDEEGMQAEYEWALEMASLCLLNWDDVLHANGGVHIAAPPEFQRHAGRTARYRGFLERAIDDYKTAIVYIYEHARLLAEPEYEADASTREITVLRDIADTFFTMGADQAAADISKLVLARVAQQEGNPVSVDDLNRLAQIEQRTHRFAESVLLQRRAVNAAEQFRIPDYIDHNPEIALIAPTRAWSETVRQPDVRDVFDETNPALNDLREAYCRLAGALRLNGQLDDAAYALETAELTPWQTVDLYRQNLDLYVDRERAFLALDRGEAAEAVRRGSACLSKYAASIHPGERIELLDLVSRALEQQGDLQGAMDSLKAAIEIVETRRANLIEDENKQLFVAGYAPLYRRALGLVLRIYEKTGAEAIEQSFEWSERIKARAMFDTLHRYDRRMARAVAIGDAAAIRSVRDLAGKVVSIEELRKAPWWRDDTALLEYSYSLENTAKTSNTSPANVYLWVITSDDSALLRLPLRSSDVDERCRALAEALRSPDRGNDKWVEAASWLHQEMIGPAAEQLRGIKRLIIVADGGLRTVPFEVFVAARNAHKKRYVAHHLLVEDFTISYAPSATLLDSISRSDQPDKWAYSLWAFASTRFQDVAARGRHGADEQPVGFKSVLRSARSLRLGDLRHTKSEVAELVSLFGDEPIKRFVDEPYMKDQLLAASDAGELDGVRFLHFATHAVADPKRPYLSGLVLCPPYPSANSSRRSGKFSTKEIAHSSNRLLTQASKSTGRPELLTIGELGRLDLGSELVVLSACHTLGGAYLDGDWLNGLARAFLVAGCSGVVCTTWETPDRVAMSVVPALYRAVRDSRSTTNGALDVPHALRRMKVAFLRSPAYGHPSVWSPWLYHGRVSRN